MLHYSALIAYDQFIIWMLTTDGRKVPLTPLAQAGNAHDPQNWMPYEDARFLADSMGASYGVGFVITESDPFFCLDIDKAHGSSGWSELSTELVWALPGALVEMSQSGTGLHLWGKYTSLPSHSKKNTNLHIELYTSDRFIALGDMKTAYGDAGTDLTIPLATIISQYFTPTVGSDAPQEWSSQPCVGWNGFTEDSDLIAHMMKARNASNAFGGKASIAQLWKGDIEALARTYPPNNTTSQYDGSSADAALAQHLAFYTGKNCDRMLRLMRQSGLVRDKWNTRSDYLERTILRACELQQGVFAFQIFDTEKVDAEPITGSSDKANNYAEQIRAKAILSAPTPEIAEQLRGVTDAGFFLNQAKRTPEQMVVALQPAPKLPRGVVPRVIEGLRECFHHDMLEMWAGCVYLRDDNAIFTPGHGVLKAESFNGEYGGYNFQMSWDGSPKPTSKAFEAFTKNHTISWPSAGGTCFRPDRQYGEVINDMVNIYKEPVIRYVPESVDPFLSHLTKLLPVERDRTILLSYMAACVQYKGTKFFWAPIIQGAKGNGKTLFTRCMEAALGERYFHWQRADEISEKFNDWLFNNIFVGVEEIYIPEHKAELMEVLKPMITNNRLPRRSMNKVAESGTVCCNFMFNTNYKNAIPVDDDERRYCIFYTAQQSAEDVVRDGMDENYFPDLYDWLRGTGKWASMGEWYGYGCVSYYLATYEIPAQFNPSGACHRAPTTSSSHEAVSNSRGIVEQEILEAVAEGRYGFNGGWISSVALDDLLKQSRKNGALPQNRRKDVLRGLGYIPHPGLPDGRVQNGINTPFGIKKPRLFVQEGHPSVMLNNASDITKIYIDAQNIAF